MTTTDPYRLDRFHTAIGATVTIDTPVGALTLRLDSVTPRPDGTGFSAIFLGPREPVAPQATYTVHGSPLDGLDLFLVPVQPIAPVDGTEYQAVITTLPTTLPATAPATANAPVGGEAPLPPPAPGATRVPLSPPTTAPGIALEPFQAGHPTHQAFDRDVYASTRADEMAQLDWPQADIDAFIDQQYHAQTTHYRATYPGLEHSVITLAGTPAGRLLLHRTPDETRIVDIAVLPAHRNRGIGRTLIERIIADSGTTPVGIHVELTNPAQRLYARLGFVEHHTHGLYRYLRTDAPPASTATDTPAATPTSPTAGSSADDASH